MNDTFIDYSAFMYISIQNVIIFAGKYLSFYSILQELKVQENEAACLIAKLQFTSIRSLRENCTSILTIYTYSSCRFIKIDIKHVRFLQLLISIVVDCCFILSQFWNIREEFETRNILHLPSVDHISAIPLTTHFTHFLDPDSDEMQAFSSIWGTGGWLICLPFFLTVYRTFCLNIAG